MVLSQLRSINRPFALMILSGILCFGIIQIWLKFPDSVPLTILIAGVLVTGTAGIVSEVIVVIRVARETTGPFRSASRIPKLNILRLFLVLIVSNTVLAYSYYRLGLGVGYILAANVAVVLSWIVSRAVGMKRQ
jgi:hypothetical protein